MRDDFAVFILTHGRADRVVTVETLKKCGYTGRWYIVIDDEDEQENQYRRIYKDRVVQFCKKEWAEKFDTMDLSQERRTIVYARNACFDIAKQLGLKYFLELDDDYTSFEFRYIEGRKLMVKPVKDMDKICEIMLAFLKDSCALTVAMAQGGDFIGGRDSGNYQRGILRKAMNSFFCDVSKPFQFIGRINEDVNTYVSLGGRGEKIFSVTNVSLTQMTTQKNKGGMSDVYLDMGTYLKSFFTVMVAPSCVKIGMMGDKHKRLHHNVSWSNAVPMILNERHKKRGEKAWLGEKAEQ